MDHKTFDQIFVSTEWLNRQLGQDRLAIIDASWHLPDAGRNAQAEYATAHIPGAVYFDIDAVRDAGSPYPHMLPSAQAFAQAVSALGIDEDQTIVVYDSVGLFSAPRVRWMLKFFGAQKVLLLEGGLSRWVSENRPLQRETPRPAARHFTARVDETSLARWRDVQAALQSRSAQVADARAPSRFEGSQSEPRPGVRTGHMPGAHNLYYGALVRNGALVPVAELQQAFKDAGLASDIPLIASCGSGVTAAILLLALEVLGRKGRLYDGSWAEWGSRDDLPIATGRA